MYSPRFLVAVSAVLMTVLSGCYVQRRNNSADISELLDHLVASGIPVESVQMVSADIVGAREAVAVKIKDNPNEIGIYRYDLKRADDSKKMDFAVENGFIYIHGSKYPVLINGSFMIIGYEKNSLKHELIAALDTF